MPYEGTGTKQAIGSNNRELVRAEPLFCQVKGPKYCYSIAIGDRMKHVGTGRHPCPYLAVPCHVKLVMVINSIHAFQANYELPSTGREK